MSGVSAVNEGATTAPERPLYRASDLQRLINPKLIAVVGASETSGSPGHTTMANLARFSGEVVAVNPKYSKVRDRDCYPTLRDMPASPDCIAMCVARPFVSESLEQAVEVRAGGAIVYASGFTETGIPERAQAQSQLVQTAQAGGVRLVGPNTIGIANVRSGASINFMMGCGEMLSGPPG